MDNPIAFVFGSGISIPAGLPSTQQITEQVMSGNSVIRHTDGSYYMVDQGYDNPGLPTGYIPRVVGFARHIVAEINEYYRHNPNRIINYEDIYYVANQIVDSESGEYDNPVVQPFIDKLSTGVMELLLEVPGSSSAGWNIHKFSVECTNYIRDIVWCSLSREPYRLDYLQIIQDAIQNTPAVHIHTLNHDKLVEQFLDERKLEYVDGFGKRNGDVRYWNPNVYSLADNASYAP